MQQFDSFAQMQRDAAMRVMEMQRRAQAAVKGSVPTPPETLPIVPEEGEALREPEPEPEEGQLAANDGQSDSSGQSADPDEESERALVAAILLLLMKEKADERLLFALMYILL